jgi:hypothetical protein
MEEQFTFQWVSAGGVDVEREVKWRRLIHRATLVTMAPVLPQLVRQRLAGGIRGLAPAVWKSARRLAVRTTIAVASNMTPAKLEVEPAPDAARRAVSVHAFLAEGAGLPTE